MTYFEQEQRRVERVRTDAGPAPSAQGVAQPEKEQRKWSAGPIIDQPAYHIIQQKQTVMGCDQIFLSLLISIFIYSCHGTR